MTSMQRGVLYPAQVTSPIIPVPLRYQAGHRWRSERLINTPVSTRGAGTHHQTAGGHLGATRRELLERLIVVADEAITTEIDPRSREWNVSVSCRPPTDLAPREGYFGQPAGSGLMSTIVWLVDIISFDRGT